MEIIRFPPFCSRWSPPSNVIQIPIYVQGYPTPIQVEVGEDPDHKDVWFIPHNTHYMMSAYKDLLPPRYPDEVLGRSYRILRADSNSPPKGVPTRVVFNYECTVCGPSLRDWYGATMDAISKK